MTVAAVLQQAERERGAGRTGADDRDGPGPVRASCCRLSSVSLAPNGREHDRPGRRARVDHREVVDVPSSTRSRRTGAAAPGPGSSRPAPARRRRRARRSPRRPGGREPGRRVRGVVPLGHLVRLAAEQRLRSRRRRAVRRPPRAGRRPGRGATTRCTGSGSLPATAPGARRRSARPRVVVVTGDPEPVEQPGQRGHRGARRRRRWSASRRRGHRAADPAVLRGGHDEPLAASAFASGRVWARSNAARQKPPCSRTTTERVAGAVSPSVVRAGAGRCIAVGVVAVPHAPASGSVRRTGQHVVAGSTATTYRPRRAAH